MAVLDDRLMVIALDGKPLARIPLRTGFCGTAVGACGKTLLCVAARESNAVSVLVFDSNLAQLGEDRLFVGLSEAEAEFIEMKLALAADLRARRVAQHLNQTQVARIIGSSQSRVAKMEAADPSVSVDLLIRTLLKLGAARRDVAKAVSRRIAVGAS
jgi:hypothetical protein